MKFDPKGMGSRNLINQLSNSKSNRIPQRLGAPNKNDGLDGDITIRRIENKIVLFGKFNGTWYGFSEYPFDIESQERELLNSDNSLESSYTSGWMEITSEQTVASGTHNLGAIPSLHTMYFSPPGNDGSLAYTLTNDSIDAKGSSYFKFTPNKFFIYQSNNLNTSKRSWGTYATSNGVPTRLGNATNGIVLGKIRINLWK